MRIGLIALQHESNTFSVQPTTLESFRQDLLLTGDPIDAATALDWGLVNRVVPAGELAGAADALARRVADASAVALGLGKAAFYEGLGMTEDVYAHASAVMCRNMLADDAREGITAFLEKRSPEWSHR